MSRSVLILLLLLALWILLGLYLWNTNKDGNSSVASGPCVVSWELNDGNSVIAESDATFNFAKSTAKIKDLDSSLETAVGQIAKYLKGNSGKSVTVIGYYDKDEKPTNGTSLRDLALARANFVKSMLTRNGASASQLAVIPKMYDEENHANSDCLDGNTLNRGVSFYLGREKGSQ